jgi:hypothetical protein
MVGIGVGVVLVLVALGSQPTSPPGEALASPTTFATPPAATLLGDASIPATPAATLPVEPTAPPVTLLPATPEPTVADAFATISLKGSGNKVPKFTIPDDQAAIATITYSGSGNFAVWSIAADGSENDLLVNVIGRYKGTVLFDAESGVHSVAMRVEASGSWTIVIKPVTKARIWAAGTTATGSGDDVIQLASPPFGLVTSVIKYKGSGNFAVWSYSTSGDRELLVNEIGNYSGEVQIPSGTYLVAIEADGPWSITSPT